MSKKPMVSIIIIFLNAEKYLSEAVESIFAQTYDQWEILLVDDGSTDTSTEIARHYERQKPGQVHYLEHPEHCNRGKGASRNLGIQHAKGDYLAFLDADDIWLPHKLTEQVAVLDKNEKVGMVYGETLYWYSWTEDATASNRDFIPPLRVPEDTPIEQPNLLLLYLRGRAAVPCPCSILVRRSNIVEVNGFEETFVGVNNIYEDQAFYSKLCLKTAVVAINRCWDRYRQHSESSMAVALRTGTENQARRFYLEWLEEYLNAQAVKETDVWLALKREQWVTQKPNWLPIGMENRIRLIKKWISRIEEYIFPPSLSYLLWMKR